MIIRNPLRALVSWIAKRRDDHDDYDDALWLPSPAGCCACGTGGPCYRGAAPPVTRYLYVGATNCGNVPDWSSCSRHPLHGLTPLVDYGQDMQVTFGQAEADCARALADASSAPEV